MPEALGGFSDPRRPCLMSDERQTEVAKAGTVATVSQA